MFEFFKPLVIELRTRVEWRVVIRVLAKHCLIGGCTHLFLELLEQSGLIFSCRFRQVGVQQTVQASDAIFKAFLSLHFPFPEESWGVFKLYASPASLRSYLVSVRHNEIFTK